MVFEVDAAFIFGAYKSLQQMIAPSTFNPLHGPARQKWLK